MAKLFLKDVPTQNIIETEQSDLYPDIDGLSLYSHVLLRKVTTDFEINLDSFFSRYNLSSGRFTLMLLLRRTPEGLMPSELAQKVGVTQATISGLINSLEKANIVQRLSHKRDGRSFVIRLTESGTELCNTVLPEYHTRISHFWSHFQVEEKKQLNETFLKMLQLMPHIGMKA